MTAPDPPKSDTPPPPLRYECAVLSDVGMRRATNQDAALAMPGRGEDAWLLMVADGMGAHAAGELASKMTVETVPHCFFKSQHPMPTDALREAIREANDRVFTKGSSSPDFHGMGTTCSCLVLAEGNALIGHVGDSRVYRLRDGELSQLTFDHSLVWEMADAGKTSEDQVPAYIPKNVITRSLGPQEGVNIDLVGPHPIEPHDTYLLCSDGLTGVVNDELIGVIVGHLAPEAAAQTLVDLANLAGGPDNISVVVARAEPGSAKAPRPVRHWGIGVWLPWGISALSLLLCALLGYQGNAIGAMLAAGVTGIAWALGAARQEKLPVEMLLRSTSLGIHGNAPYRTYACRDLRPSIEVLAKLVQELAGVDLDNASGTVELDDPEVGTGDLGPCPVGYRDRVAQADTRLKEGDLHDALVQYAALIRERMRGAAPLSSDQDSRVGQ